ncbi:UNVERIFIED_CONTAM: 2-hydroxyisoflavanone dehydratase [Sesamum indicum]
MSGKKSFSYLLLILHFLTTTAAASSSAVLYDIYPFIRVYKDGTVKRFIGTEVVPASVDPTTGVRSKDVVITAPELHISARLYLPKYATSTHKLPLLVYFHGGAFFTESAFSPLYHNHLNSIVAKANVVAVSVNYRLAPEHPLPIGYQDSWHALKWVFSHSDGNGNETWLKNYADFMHVYLGGDSAGGNIAHNTAIRAGLEHEMVHRVVIDGMFLNCPHFWGKTPIGNEASKPKREALMESIWIHAYPNSTGLDDPLVNPAMDPNLSKLRCKRVLVYVAEKDILRDRGWYYEKALRKSKWDGVVKVVEVKGEDHDFSIIFPNSRKAKIVLRQLASFLNQGKVLDSFAGHLTAVPSN